ncbi:MAG: hypothetical protein LBN09_01785 [Clostridioides sp.]|jgi:predicted nucleotidyltransferase|nr:hypothetical protein [Clostridioides sp.]
MVENLYDIYAKEIEKIKSNSEVYAIFLVGSAKNLDMRSTTEITSDIDIFVITECGGAQTRILKEVEGIEFDINYCPVELCEKLIKDGELFFIKQMSSPRVVYDREGISDEIIVNCREKYKMGPGKLSEIEINFLNHEIYSSLKKLEYIEKYEKFEYDFLTKLILKDIIMAYFKLSGRWLPKDKKMLSSLREADISLYNMYERAYNSCDVEGVREVYEYVFGKLDKIKYIELKYD